MTELLVQVAVYGLAAAAAAPIAAVVSALIIGTSKRPLASGWAFVAGAAFVDVIFCAVVLASGLLDVSSDVSAYIDLGLGLLFLVMGIMAIFSNETPEKDAARRARAAKIAGANLSALFVAGILVQLVNIDAIAVFAGALKEIASAELPTAQVIIATAFGLAIMLSVYYVPILVYMVNPARASTLLGRMSEWILGHSRQLEIWVGILFGLYFLAKGVVALV